jgi:hypothetical protein
LFAEFLGTFMLMLMLVLVLVLVLVAVAGDWTADWVYVAGPLIGAVIAVGGAVILRGRGGDPTARAAASGGLDSEPERVRPRL